MPSLSPIAQNVVRDARVTTAELSSLKAAVQSGTASVSDVETIAHRFVDCLEGGAGDALRALLRDLGSRASIGAPIANLSASPGVLNGTVVFPRDKGSRRGDVENVQKALLALASRTGDAGLGLPRYGADGGWGSETEAAVKAFQAQKGLPQTGALDLATATALDNALRDTRVPPIFAGGVDPNVPGPGAMHDAAVNLVTKHPNAYGVDDPWVNCDPRHALPANVRLGGLTGKWKCNLFACNVIAAAGFEPPYIGNKGHGEYPNANQLYKWSGTHAAQWGNANHVRFELRAEFMGMNNVTDPDEKERRVKALLAKVEPGDMLIVDHQGGAVADGGHCRVCTAKNADGTFEFAQASFTQAEIQTEGVQDVIGEEAIWVLRPNKRRPEGPAPIL